MPSAVRIVVARAEPRVTERLVWPRPRVNSTRRTVRSTRSASVADRSSPAALSFFSSVRCSKKASAATKMWARTRGTEDLAVIQPMRLFHSSNLYLSLLFVAVALDPLLTR